MILDLFLDLDSNVRARRPDLRALLAIPPPPKHVVSCRKLFRDAKRINDLKRVEVANTPSAAGARVCTFLV